MRQAGLDSRCKRRWRKTTVADPDAELARDLIQRDFGPCEEIGPALCRRYHLHLDVGGLGLPGHGHRPGQPPGRRLGPRRSHAHRAGRRRPHQAFDQPGTERRCHFSFGQRAVNIRAETSPSWPGPTASCSRSDARASAGTTRWPRAFFATIKRELIDTGRGRRRPDSDAPSSNTSRAGTTPAGCTRRSATSVRLNTKLSTTTPTVRRHNQHKQPVRRTGSSPSQSVSWVSHTPSRSRRCRRGRP